MAEAELRGPLPRWWLHSLGVSQRATELAEPVGGDTELLVSAAVLHDVSYAPRLTVNGFPHWTALASTAATVWSHSTTTPSTS
ncbi:HD domain-containing protein [Streptomyces sp. NBC_00683]|uniref:HD domain-containing protein n=1 Tax=Streptomyces sp. NBC_00683 TaxID=2903670 RepID=UPI003FA7A120